MVLCSKVLLFYLILFADTFDIGGLDNLVEDDVTTVGSAGSATSATDYDSFLSVLDGLLLDLGYDLDWAITY